MSEASHNERHKLERALPVVITIVGNPTLADAMLTLGHLQGLVVALAGTGRLQRALHTRDSSRHRTRKIEREPGHGEVAIAALRSHAASLSDLAFRLRHRSAM